MKIKNSFSITQEEGIKYSKKSGDKNKIHINSNYGYNSIFGCNICHGTLVILYFLKKIKFKYKKNFYIYFNFRHPFFYEKKIFIKKKINKKDIKYKLIQDNKEKAEIILSFSNKYQHNVKQIKSNNNFLKKIFIKKSEIEVILNTLSMYVGNIYPGENSLISKIKIFHSFNKENKKKNIINIHSKILNKGFPIVSNYLRFNSYEINFETILRPAVKNKKINIPKYLRKIVNKVDNNVLIIGGSQGIGKYIFDIYKYNKKITKIITYNKNIINYKSPKTIIKKIDILKDQKKISELIRKYSPLKIYYFPTSKIYFDNKLAKNTINGYKKIFINLPLNILKKNKREKIIFFYPSTTNIELNKDSIYSKIKLIAEQKIKMMCKKFKIKYHIYRFPAIYSRQSVSLINPNPINLIDHINQNKNIIKILF